LIQSLPLVHRGKVRDVYRIDANRLLMVATDRLSAFDVILPDPIPGKGALLTAISNFWFDRLAHIVPNHLINVPLAAVLSDAQELAYAQDRAVVVKSLRPLPVEAVVRGYLAGSGLKDYQRSGEISGVQLPPGLVIADRLPAPIFTPSSKAAVGEHDEPISFAQLAQQIGTDLAERIRDLSLQLYAEAHRYAQTRGILIADTKFEFGLDQDGTLTLMDEVLTPDSSRFWQVDSWQPGQNPPSFDKQFVRDWLESVHWDKRPPGPALPAAIIEGTQKRYQEALARLIAV
jgi:phosphoribosylaminoimidazole-succinocarboxamide synthase